MSEAALKQGEPTAMLDIDRIRSDFPILTQEVNGKPLVYLDSAASAQKPNQVIDSMAEGARTAYSNVHRGLHHLSTLATERYEAARKATRAYLNAAREEEIIFTMNATDAINLVAASYGGEHIGEGDEIILTEMEHHSNIVPWHFHRERNGAVIKWAPIDDDGNFLLEEFEKLITPRTKMIAVTMMSNVLGTIVPIRKIVEMAHAQGIPVLVDGTQAAVHLKVDVQELGCDFFVCTGHKLYGPSGIGILYGRKERLEAMRPWRGGGEMIREVHFDRASYADLPMKFEAGTPQILEAFGLTTALEYIEGIGREAIMAHENEIGAYAMERLEALDWIEIYGKAPGKGAIVAFNIKGVHAHDLSTIVDKMGVAVRAGHHCCQPLMTRLGITSSARASIGVYNTREDIDRLVEALEKAHRLLA